MSRSVKIAIGLLAVLLMGWLFHGPLGRGAGFADALASEQGVHGARELLAVGAGVLGHRLERLRRQRRRLGRRRGFGAGGQEKGWQHGSEKARKGAARHRRAVLPPGIGQWQPQSEPLQAGGACGRKCCSRSRY